MKKISIIGLLLFFVLSAWAQDANKPGQVVRQKDQGQVQTTTKTSQHSKTVLKETAVQNKNQENVIEFQQAGQSPKKVKGIKVQNTVSGDKKVRVPFGSAYDSGPKQKMEKPNEPSKCTQAELKKTLPPDVKKVELFKTTTQDE